MVQSIQLLPVQLRALLLAMALVGCANCAIADDSIQFNQHIRPILSRHCIACHGPDEDDRQADLRLDTFAGSIEDLGGYAAIKPGDPDQSELIARILTDDEDLRMPPAGHAEPLKAEEVELLTKWILTGSVS